MLHFILSLACFWQRLMIEAKTQAESRWDDIHAQILTVASPALPRSQRAVPRSRCAAVTLSRSPATPLSRCAAVTLSGYPAVTLSRGHAVPLSATPRSRCAAVTLCRGHAVPRSRCAAVTLCRGHAVPRSRCAAVPLPRGPATPPPLRPLSIDCNTLSLSSFYGITGKLNS